MGADETQEEQIARHLAGDVHDSDVASDADSSSDDDDDDASTSSVEVLSNANGAVPTATAVRFRRRNPKRPNTQSHARYEKYKSATTVKQFLDRGGTRADLRNDVDKGFAKLGKGLAASGVAEGVASKAGLFAEATGKAGALGESTTALAAKVAPVLDSTVAKATLGAAEGAGLAAGFTGVTVAGAEYMKQNLGVVLGIGALLGLAKWAGDALNEPQDGPLDKRTKK